MNKEIEVLIEVIYKSLNAVQKGFDVYQVNYFPNRTPEFFCLELNGEAGELANLEKKEWKGKKQDAEKFGDEAADVMIALMNYSNARNIDLASEVIKKLKKIDEKRENLKSKGEDY